MFRFVEDLKIVIVFGFKICWDECIFEFLIKELFKFGRYMLKEWMVYRLWKCFEDRVLKNYDSEIWNYDNINVVFLRR